MPARWDPSEQLQAAYADMVEWRRYLHRNPELSFREQQTSSWIAKMLRSFGCDVQEGVGGYGVVAELSSDEAGPCVALRADIDALPIEDAKSCDYASAVPGVMHACGHDAHTSTLLAIARTYAHNRSDWKGTRRFLFQPAEELCPGGAVPMIKDGALEGVEAIYGVHLWTPLPYGTLASRGGPFMAAPDEFTIQIVGKGGHGGLPHQTIDAVVAGASLVQSLQTIVSRNVDPTEPAVVTVGSFQAGTTGNVIAERATLHGTVRTFRNEVRAGIRSRMETVIQHIAEMFGAQITLDYREGYPAVVNDDGEAERFQSVAKRLFGDEAVQLSGLIMAGEDFSYYLQQVPGCFMFVGAGNDACGASYPHHHPRFDIDERAMLHAARLLIGMAEHRASGTAPAG
ncbi:M20 metallopeptidase family protein [Paenibacillus sp. MMS18-CY102]|uniref:M20 metallopeptidase family protein n=1 Tax=Paenibacillus sp. MMS18-CY102 TaxID=2682849 RepID=UPI001365B678|nr:M20 family metallopeptidase [Paenibacillus sp. MMS18-CY102]MWC26735.1 amidohydrolase [Paenibacillus sp. MMS18-CY102]